ncbi:outer membrane protein assembly factor BamA [Acetobacteraceae bacterium H6797]|nr:outer membrane protein assembly factor BamA [Acetobacteraceae bacterium H6797]
MYAHRALLLAATCLIPFAADPASAQSRRAPSSPQAAAQQGGVISAIEVRGNQRIEAATVRSYMLVQPGDPYDADRVDRSLRTLFGTGLFKDATITRNGSTLIVQVVENPSVNRVAFEGNRKVSDDVLQAAIQLRPRAVFTPQVAQADRQTMLDLYARRGRFGTQIEPKIIQLDQNRVDVVFEIKESDAALVSRVSFVGNTAFSDSKLKEIVGTREQAWYRFLSDSDTYQPERMNFDRELLRRYYQRHGYADAEVTGASAELSPSRDSFFVTYTINEGPLYHIGKVDVTSSVRNLDASRLRDRSDVDPGEVYDGDAIERSAQAIQDEANLRGFPFVEVTPKLVRHADSKIIDVTFEIADGPRGYVERIDITGNTRTQDRVIRREMRIAEGDAFNATLVRRSRQRIQDLGYFSSVNIANSQGSEADKVLLNTQVVERATGEVSLGGGFSTDAGALADISLRERNILGTGIDARIGTQIAQKSSQIDLSVTDPQFLDRNLTAGFDLFAVRRNLLDYSGYEERRYGGAIRIGYEFNEHLRQTWSYSLIRRNVFNIDPNASIYIKDQAGVSVLSQISQTIAYDRRDSRLEPRSGWITRFGTDFAGLGGDVSYVRLKLDGAYYIPLEQYLGDQNYVIAIQGTVGTLQPTGGKDERIIDRFFLGGDNLRGFATAGAGPRDISTKDSLGGRTMWTQSTEFRFPLPVPDELGLLGRTFVDIGSLSGSSSGANVADDGSPRVGVGVGISWRSPMGLINIDLAQAVVKKSYDETQVFRFGFGTRF